MTLVRTGFPRLAAAALLALVPGLATATPAKQAPWLPEAAAYRTTLFMANLKPVPWDKIAEAWSEPAAGAEIDRPALERLEEGVDPAALDAALDAQDRQALFAAATRLLAHELLATLDQAAATLDEGGAQHPIAEARGLYRAFEDGIAAADPQAARELGRAWLTLSTAAGSPGVLGAGGTKTDRDRFDAAHAQIADYIAASYLPESFGPRATLSTLPEPAAQAGAPLPPPALPPGSQIADQDPLPLLVLNFEEQGIDETDLPLIAYGDMLFDSAQIFGDPARSLGIACSTCHNRSDINQAFFIPGASHQPGAVDVDGEFFNPMFNDRRDDPIDIPSLRGLRFTGPYGRDGRFGSLRDFTRNVIVNEFGGDEPTPFMLDALVGYMLEFDWLPNSQLTAQGELTDAATDAARRGEEIFNTPFAGMDGQSCSSCHIPSANFLDRKAHDIGSAAEPYAGARAGAFDTPSLLGAKYTAPYFHDGSLPTLASVVEWFDETKALGLSDDEKTDLTAYLEAVGDADEPYQSFGERDTPFRLAFEELTTFASTLSTLIPARDAQHVLLLTDTVAADLAADASTMSNLAARPEIYQLAETLEAVGEAVRAEDWATAEARWADFQAQQAEIDERVF